MVGREPPSQFGRVLQELDVALPAAHLPQANRFSKSYLCRYTQRFAVPPAKTTDLHRSSLPRRHLDRTLCLKTNQVLRRDWTVAHAPRMSAYLSHDRGATCVGGGGRAPASLPPSIFTQSHPSVAEAVAAGPRGTTGNGRNINRIVLRWEEEAISKLG